MLKKFTIWFGIGLLIGTILANFLKMGTVQEFMDYHISLNTINRSALYFYIWKQRINGLVVLWLLSFTIFCAPSIYGYLLYYGFTIGAMLSALTMEMGIKSIFIYIGFMFPQGFIYIPIWLFFVMKCLEENKKFRSIDAYGRKKSYLPQLVKWFGVFALVLAGYSVGIAAETFVNPWMVYKILSFL